MQAEPFEVVERIVERVNFQFAAVARAGVDLADRQRTPELGARGTVDALRQFGETRRVGLGRSFGERPMGETFQQRAAH